MNPPTKSEFTAHGNTNPPLISYTETPKTPPSQMIALKPSQLAVGEQPVKKFVLKLKLPTDERHKNS